MNLTAGYPYFLIHDGLPYDYPKLDRNIATDVLVVGGGISGALVAHQLTESGVSCVVVDGRSIGLGSTCASTSLLQYELDISLCDLKAQIGEDKATQAYRSCGESIASLLDLMEATGYHDYHRSMSLYFSLHRREKDFLQDEYEARKAAGFQLEYLSGAEVKALYGIKASGGILSKTGATVNAYSLTHHLLQRVIQRGVSVYDRTKIITLDSSTESVTAKTEQGFAIDAKFVVNATGYEVVNFIGKDIVNFDCTYAIATEQFEKGQDPWRDRIIMWNTDDPYLYLRLTEDNRIIIGGRDERVSNKVTRELFLEKKARKLEKDLSKLLPQVALKREFAWCGTFGKTKDALPYIGPWHKTPRVLYALGFGGNGITYSRLAAEILTDHICGKVHKDAKLFSFER